MLLTQQNYEVWKNEHEKGISTDADRIMFETFQALRNVARAAEDCIYGKEPLSVDEADMKAQLDALPAWILEDE